MWKGDSIAFAEIGFMEAFCKIYRLSKMFIVENAFEWGTLALALMNLDARERLALKGGDHENKRGVGFRLQTHLPDRRG